ncbi:phage portal protein [Streptomyces sp. NPDC088733]|uniref:phage portal protein n=1 Tax=Streptomyces sp. NPDC088733 TaxID=3365880 RepID=UPI003803FAA2
MPLPAEGTPWPPVAPEIRCSLDDWAAWYSANPDRIADRYYNRQTHAGRYGQPRNRPSQYRGGIIGGLARMFWGEPTPLGEKRTKLHVPLAADIARTSSDLLFSEPPALKVEDPATQEQLEEMLATDLRRTLLTAGETGAALGGAYLRTSWDLAISDRPWISTVAGDAGIPEFRYGRLLAVTITDVLEVDGQTVIRHLERHERGWILHEVYRGTVDNLGKPIGVKAFEQTRDLLTERQLDAPDRLTISYMPNTVTARDWRDIPGTAGLGQSDYQGSETLLDALDETYTSWMRDVRLAKSRIIVPDGYLQSNGPGRGASWEDREVMVGMNIPPTESGKGITLNQFEIRHAEHKATAEELLGKIIRNAGYSGGTFGDDSDGAALTATEIKARNARSMSTRARKAELAEPAIADIVEATLALWASNLFPGAPPVQVQRPEVVFQDSVQDDLKTLADTALALRQAEAASTETLVALVHPDWDEKGQKAEVARITKESGRAVEDPTTIGDRAGQAEPDTGGTGGGGFPG